MQHILIVEDNQNQLSMLTDTIKGEYPSWEVDSCYSYNDAMSLIKNSVSSNPYTLFLLDVQLTKHLTDRGGFQLAQEIRKMPVYYRTSILFLTGVIDEGVYALSNFHCYNYITKPYSGDDILNQLEQMVITGYLEKYFTVRDTNRIVHKIKIADIRYVHASRHLKTVFLNNCHIDTREYSLDELQTMSDGKLVMCQKSYLVNPDCISSFDKVTNSVIIDGVSIPIGKKYKDIMGNYI